MKRRWKSITFDYADLQGQDDNDIIYVCLTQRKIAVLKALLITAYWSTRWSNEAWTDDDRDAWVSDLDYRLSGGNCDPEVDMTIFRTNPDDPCLVEWSNDNGLNWILMFRKDNCQGLSGGTTLIQTETNITTITNNNITYAGDIINIAPKWVYSAGVTDETLCWVIRKFVGFICDFHLAQMTDNSGWLTVSNFAEKALSLITAIVVGIAASTGRVGVAASAAVSWALAEQGFDIINAALSNNKEDYEDEDAREIVACWIYNNVKGATPQFASWSTALDDFSGGNDAEDAIVSIVDVALGNEDLYVNYLFALEDVNDISASLPGCPCQERWEHYWNFATHGADTWFIASAEGHWEDGVGFVADDRIIPPWHDNMVWFLTLPGGVPNCDGWRYHCDVVRGDFDQHVDAVWMEIPPLSIFTRNQGTVITGYNTWRHNFALTDLDYVRFGMRSCHTEVGSLGSLIVIGMTLYGEGVDPFRHRITS